MNTALVGLICSAVTLVIKAIIDLCIDRYKRAQEIQDHHGLLEADLRTQAFLWKEHAYAVRVAAVQAGVKVEDLPSVPKED